MAFKRMEGFAGSVPQGFIDRNVKVCPFCGSNNPHWAIDQKMQMKMEGNLYLFQCEQCKGVLSSPVPDVTGFNNTILTTTGLIKNLSGKQNGVIYMRVYDAGNNADFVNKVGTEYTLEQVNQIAAAKAGSAPRNERYSRFFSLPDNLYTEGSPVVIVAGGLLKDNLTGDIVAQLKFRNVSEKVIRSVRVKINAYDAANNQRIGVEAFSYLNFSVMPNEEFGQGTPICLPDVTTRSFSAEILSVEYADNVAFSSNVSSATVAAPQPVSENVQQIKIEQHANWETVKAERVEKIKKGNIRYTPIVICSCISVALVILGFIWSIAGKYIPFAAVLRNFSVPYILALIPPCVCLLAALGAKKAPVVLKPAAIICGVFLAVQIISIIVYPSVMKGSLARSGSVGRIITHIMGQFGGYVNGVPLRIHLWNVIKMFGRVPDHFFKTQLMSTIPALCPVISNILCTTVMLIFCKKSK